MTRLSLHLKRRRPSALRGALIAGLLAAGAAMGCRGDISDKPPIHLVWNMDNQKRLDPQEPFAFFKDGRAMRLPPTGTVARGHLRTDDHLFRGKVGDKFVSTLPPRIAQRARREGMKFIERGKDRFLIFCAPCHGAKGNADSHLYRRSLRKKLGLQAPASFLDDKRLGYALGRIFYIMSYGNDFKKPAESKMPAMANKLPVEDRWAIALYVRALQRASYASGQDISLARRKGWVK